MPAPVDPATARIRRTFADHLAPHEPLYFIAGADAPAAKFQISFKYKVLDLSGLSRRSRARSLQLGFTQRSLWDVDAASSPFYDTSYMPELIYESLAPMTEGNHGGLRLLGFQAAGRHESNGRDGGVSRSLNYMYLRPIMAFGRLDGWHVLFIPELNAYVGGLGDNGDLRDTRDRGRLTLVLGHNDGPSATLAAWAGRRLRNGSMQIDLTIPMSTRLFEFATYALVQYFHGYGESLLAYRDKSRMLRAGICLIR